MQNTFGVFNGALNAIAVVVISFYLVAEEKGMKTFVASLIAGPAPRICLEFNYKIQRKMGGWVLGQIIISFGIFFLLILACSFARPIRAGLGSAFRPV